MKPKILKIRLTAKQTATVLAALQLASKRWGKKWQKDVQSAYIAIEYDKPFGL